MITNYNYFMKKVILLSTMTMLLISCSSSEETKSLAPDFGYHVDRIVSVLEKQIVIGTFTAVVPDGGEVTYSSSNSDMSISSEGELSFILEPDYEIQNEYLTEITASNDSGSDTINVKVKVLDSLCEYDTAAVFDDCIYE